MMAIPRALAGLVLVGLGLAGDARAAQPCGFMQVSAGYAHTCGVRTDGKVACWGRGLATRPPAVPFVQVSAGRGYTCGVSGLGGLVWCWGDNPNGAASPPAGPFVQVSAAEDYTCGVRTDGTVACWGNNRYGAASPPAGAFVQVSTGRDHACGVQTDGTVACWGRNNAGQASSPAGAFTQVSAGGDHTCGVQTDGTVACWGRNNAGQASPPAGAFTQVSAGWAHTCGVQTDGTVACWGANDDGQASPPAGAFTQVSAGYKHTCGVRTDGTVACWGNPAVTIPRVGACESDCTSTPRAGCFTPGKASLRIRDKNPGGVSPVDRRDALTWRWAKGPALTQADFGNPTTTTDYALCLYTGEALALEIKVFAGARWSAIGTKGYKFFDPRQLQGGTQRITEKWGAAGESQLYHRGKGNNLPLSLPLGAVGGDVRAQVQHNPGGNCWEANFPAAAIRKNTAEEFEAKLP